MNEERRKNLEKAITLVNDAREIVDEMKGSEEEALESLPEGLKSGDRGERMQVSIDALSEAQDNLENAIDQINSAKE